MAHSKVGACLLPDREVTCSSKLGHHQDLQSCVPIVSGRGFCTLRLRCGAEKRFMLYVVRLTLGMLAALTHGVLRRAVTKRLGTSEARWLNILTAVEFHLPFYMSRTLPNTFALLLANLAHAALLEGSGYSCLCILAVAAAIFRCDLLLLIAPVGLLLLAQRTVSFLKAAVLTAAAAAGGALLSVLVDSYMWSRLLWPEFVVLWFNTAENRSSEWGTSPRLWYFYSALPRALLGALPLALVGVTLERRVRTPALAALAFVILYSALAHKELRFLFPVLPLFNVAAAAGHPLTTLRTRRKRHEVVRRRASLTTLYDEK
eukprot:1937851-Amphidinium_carterae.1